MQNKKLKNQLAFSFAEALITMIVVTLIIMMSAPMITGKKKAGARPHGIWECYIENGKHVSVRDVQGEGKTKKVEGEYCTFEPQPSTEKYSVTVIGGGGGGASGSSITTDAISYGSTVGYRIETAGKYDILLVGGGGGGSAKMGSKGHLGGSAGHIYVEKDKLLTPGYYVLRAGVGGTNGGEEDDTTTSNSSLLAPTTCTEENKDIFGNCLGGGGGVGPNDRYEQTINNRDDGGGGGGGYTPPKQEPEPLIPVEKPENPVIPQGPMVSIEQPTDWDATTPFNPGSTTGTTDLIKTCATSGKWEAMCDGNPGESSVLYKVGDNSKTWEARGGCGGGETKDSKTEYDENTKCKAYDYNAAREAGCDSITASGIPPYYGGRIFAGGSGGLTTKCSQAREILGEDISRYMVFGHGGNGSAPGFNGIVIIRSSEFFAGGGGKAGGVSYMTLSEFKDPIKVYVGAGGEGAKVENTRGLPGENTSFGNYITAKGGDGGTIQAKSSVDKANGIAGEEGRKSPYGNELAGGSASCKASDMNGKNDMDTNSGNVDSFNKKFAGAGGGGGAAFSSKSTTCSLDKKWGKGGRGASGYVRVEWN